MVLPKGIRNLTYKEISGTIRDQYNSDGSRSPLFNKPISFQMLANKKNGISKKLAEAFFRNHFELSDAAGYLRANLAANIRVQVPLLSYGLTKNITLAVGSLL